MVRGALAVAMTLLATPAFAQSVDWSAAGGDLFGENLDVETVAGPEPQARVPALAQPLQAEIRAAAEAYGLDEKLLHAVVLQESGYDPAALSAAGAAGLTQLMPATARALGVGDRFDPVQNLRGGADYLARQIIRFQDLRLALAAFNAGPARVARLGREPDIFETRHYVQSVIDCYLALSAGRRLRSANQCAVREPGG